MTQQFIKQLAKANHPSMPTQVGNNNLNTTKSLTHVKILYLRDFTATINLRM